jgi:hypothetical protein
MKKFILSVLALGVVSTPLMAEKKLEMPKVVHKSANFYVSNSFSLSVTPGLRLQYNRFGVDLGATIAPVGVITGKAAGIVYLNPYSTSKWQHNLSFGATYFPNVDVQGEDFNGEFFSVEADGGVVPLVSYGFQRQLKGDSYWFMDFGLLGPVEFKTQVGSQSADFIIPLPLLNIGYAF